MYAGQFANASGPLTTFGVAAADGDASTEASADGDPPGAVDPPPAVDALGAADVPVLPVHAARNAATPTIDDPCRKRRRVRSGFRRSGCSAMGWLLQ